MTAQNSKDNPVFKLVVPRSKVKVLLAGLKNFRSQYQGLEIHPIPLITVFKLSLHRSRKPAVEITPCIQLTLQNGEIRLWEEARM